MFEPIIVLEKDSENIFGVNECSCCNKKTENLSLFSIGSKTRFGAKTSSFRLCDDCIKLLKKVVGEA